MRKTWVLKKGKKGLEGYVFKAKGKHFVSYWQGEIAPKTLRGERVILIFDDPQAYFSRETLVKGPPEVLELQIREHLRNFGLVDEGLRIAFKIEEENPPHVLVSFLACHLSGVKNILEELLQNVARLVGLHHYAIALAALGNLSSRGPLLVAEAQPQGLWLVIVEDQKIQYLRFFEADEFAELSPNIVEEAILSALDYAQRGLKKEIRKILPLGKKRDLLPSVQHLEFVELDESRFPGVPKDTILEEPAFFGGLFCPQDFDLTPPLHGAWLKNLKWARISAGILLVLSLFNLGGWYHFSQENRHLQREVAHLEEGLREKTSQLQKVFPPPVAERFGKFWEIYQRFSQEPRLDFFLVWLAQNLPPKAQVIDFDFQREGPEGVGLVGHLRIRLQAPFETAQEEFSRFSQRLSTNNFLQKSRLTYSEQTGEGFFEFEFKPQSKKD